ncbi:MAG: TetR-like C-terminal domain-containing protein, partial [Mycobacterium sp.]
VMFGGETVKAEHPGLLTAGGAAFGDMLGAITRCQESGMMSGQDPLDIAGPLWSLIHGIASLSSGGDLKHMGIQENPEALVERALTRGLLLGELS